MKIVTVYTQTSCSSSRKAIKFLKENNIPYREIKLGNETITKEHLELLMETSENGFEDLVKRTALNDLLDLGTEECKLHIISNPKKLRTPVMIQGFKSSSGYNEEEITMFFNREKRMQMLQEAKTLLKAI